MPGPISPDVIDDAIQRYLAGEAFEQIQAATGIGVSVFHRHRKRRGIPPRRELVLPTEEIAAAYLAGESEYSLSRRYGIGRGSIRLRLEASGIKARGPSKAGLLRAAKMTPEERASQAAAAHAAARGSKRTPEELLDRARSIEVRGQCDSPAEATMAGWLTARGEDPIPQKAVGKYNVDLAVAPVAVEILGGGWHSAKRTHATRTPQILNAGWNLAFVWDYEGRSALTEHAADYVVAWLHEVRRQPSAIGQYRVIAGNGELLARGGADDPEFTLEPPPRGR